MTKFELPKTKRLRLATFNLTSNVAMLTIPVPILIMKNFQNTASKLHCMFDFTKDKYNTITGQLMTH